MGLSINADLSNGLSVNNAYHRIDAIGGSKETMLFTLNSYVSKEAYQEGKSYLAQKQYKFTPTVEDGASNFIKQAYEYLKRIPEFKGALDV